LLRKEKGKSNEMYSSGSSTIGKVKSDTVVGVARG